MKQWAIKSYRKKNFGKLLVIFQIRLSFSCQIFFPYSIVAIKFGINTTSIVLKMDTNFMRPSRLFTAIYQLNMWLISLLI